MCRECPLRESCIPQKTAYKRIFRWEHEEIVERHLKKMQTKEAKAILKQRGSMAEHPFGTVKQTLGWSHFLVRGKEKVSGENALVYLQFQVTT